jgi:hypothetical protein
MLIVHQIMIMLLSKMHLMLMILQLLMIHLEHSSSVVQPSQHSIANDRPRRGPKPRKKVD